MKTDIMVSDYKQSVKLFRHPLTDATLEIEYVDTVFNTHYFAVCLQIADYTIFKSDHQVNQCDVNRILKSCLIMGMKEVNE